MFSKLRFWLVLVLSIFVSIFIWAMANQPEWNGEVMKSGNQMKPQIKQQERNHILAEDLALTASLFIQQLIHQLNQWSQVDLSSKQLNVEFSTEIKEHPHFHAFGIIENGRWLIKTGQFSYDPLAKLNLYSDQDEALRYSDPYMVGEKQLMLIGKRHEEKDRWYVGEADLAFIKQFIGELASVADANGHFFIGGDEADVQIEKNDKTEESNHEEVPEVGWTIFVRSTGEEGTDEQDHFHDGEVLVQFISEEAAQNWVENHPEYKVIDRFSTYAVLRDDQRTTEELIRVLEADPAVQKAEYNYIYTKQGEIDEKPNDEFFAPYQWNLSQIKAESGWLISEGVKNVPIAILDTGVDAQHRDLAPKLTEGYNAIEENDDFQDQHGHGTHVAGIAAAVTNNVIGIAGVSWHNAIMPVKVLDENGEGGLFEVIQGIMWATDHGAKVINLSLGDDEHSDLLYDAIRYAYERDVVLVAAAGNDNVATPMYPAAYPEVLAVAAVNQMEEKALFSNYGRHIDVTAPGEHIPSTFIGNQYVFMSGTSMAAPHVSGLAALIRSFYPELSNQEVIDLIRQTADDLGPKGHDPIYGYGQINVYRALDHIRKGKEIMRLDAIQDGDPLHRNDATTVEFPPSSRAAWLQRLMDNLRTWVLEE